MAENSKIQWTTHTFNPWRGCQKVAAGCANCYAETLSKRNPGTLGIWGPNGTRVLASEAMWREPEKWNKEAFYDSFGKPLKGESHDRPRVFCASLADVFEDRPGPMRLSSGLYAHHGKAWGETSEVCGRDIRIGKSIYTLGNARARLFRLIDATPNLDWLLLTKRPNGVRRMWPAYQNDGNGTRDYSPRVDGVMHGGLRLDNAWLGTSIANQADADKNLPELLRCRDLAAKLFVSVEPLVGPVDLHLRAWQDFHGQQGLDWVIVGGESGPHARPCNVEWVRSIVRQCKDAGVPCFVKQLGAEVLDIDPASRCSWPGLTEFHQRNDYCRVLLRDPKGGDQSEWPEDLRVREFPVA
jgi:protein gp37